MKYLITALSFLGIMNVKGQQIRQLSSVRSGDTILAGQAIMYGNFIQRLAFSSGGFPQDIRLVNLDTKAVLAFRVKPTFKSAKDNNFIYVLPPGNYAILHYWWTRSKWYGGKSFTEPIYKGLDATDHLEQKINSGDIQQDALQLFRFSIAENTLNYMGTWHFDTGIVSFSDDKLQLDNRLKGQYKKLDFSSAKTLLPK